MHQFYTELFPKNVFNSNEVIAHYIMNISLPKLTKEQSKQFEGKITKKEVNNALGNMVCHRTTGNDGLTSRFYKSFGPKLKTSLLLTYKGFSSGKLSISQKQTVIEVIDLKKKIKH